MSNTPAASPPSVDTTAEKDAAYPSLRGRRVFITGGATGIGAALVEAFARQHARVAFVDIAADAAIVFQE